MHFNDPDNDRAVARYLWNAALCESLYPVLHGVEVALRNCLDTAFTGHFGPGWIASGELLGPKEMDRVQVAARKLRDRGKVAATKSDLVAEVSFSFWVALFSTFYERPNRLWPALSNRVLVGAPSALRTRRVFHGRLEELRRLRNRAFHHEPVWHWRDLDGQHDRALELLGWFSPELKDFTMLLDRYGDVKRGGFELYEGLLEGASPCLLHGIPCRTGSGGVCPSRPVDEVEELTA